MERKYKLLIFYSTNKFKDNIKEVHLLEKVLASINPQIDLYQGGTIRKPKLEYENIRKKKVTSTELEKNLQALKTDNSEEISYYVNDKSFSDTNPPIIFINIKFYEKTSLYCKNEKNQLGTYFLFAIDNSNEISNTIVDDFKMIFKKWKGVIGYLFDNADYYFDGQSEFAWAFQNIPAKTKSNDISNWKENAEKLIG